MNGTNNPNGLEIATLGGGCFWCIETIFVDLIGVEKVLSGYSGGEKGNPTYQEVCSGSTGHAEVIQITFDPQVITYEDLLKIFFTVHDPTTLNRQGPDVGTQYRSVIFYHNETQKEIAENVIRKIEGKRLWDDPIVTQIAPFEAFYIAEEYHQDYFNRNPDQGYCRVVIAPKVAKFRQKYSSRLKSISE